MTKDSDYTVGKYPEIDYSGFADNPHEVMWVNHIVRLLEDDERAHQLSGIVDFMHYHEKDKRREELIRARLPKLKVIKTYRKVYWTRDSHARARLVTILLNERDELLKRLESIEEAIGTASCAILADFTDGSRGKASCWPTV